MLIQEFKKEKLVTRDYAPLTLGDKHLKKIRKQGNSKKRFNDFKKLWGIKRG